MASIEDVYCKFNGLSDDAWLEILCQSVEQPVINDVEMPRFPHPEVQIGMQGSSNRDAMTHAFRFFKETAPYSAYCGRALSADRMLLDFGCGWGRITRCFMRDLRPQNIFGLEPEPDNIAIARSCNHSVNFVSSGFLPPAPFSSSTFDLITAFSVFSHLDEYTSNRWIEEFARILKPGGLFVFTTMPLAYLDYCRRTREDLKESVDAHGALLEVKRSVAGVFADFDAAEREYHDHGFVYATTSGHPPMRYARWGWTLITRKYIERVWRHLFGLVDFVEDHGRLDQALVVLQKPMTC